MNPKTASHPAHVVAIIQARMNSTRLPGKVLLDLAGKPMLAHVVERTRLAKTVNQVVVATTIDSSDLPLVQFCRTHGVEVFSGSQFDVLDRYYQAASLFDAQVVVRITADCPLIDPTLIDLTVNYFLGLVGQPSPRPDDFPWDFAANRLPPPWGRTYPIGLDVEVCSYTALRQAWENARQPHQREHVMPYLYEFSPIADSQQLAAYIPPDLLPEPADPQQPRFRALLVNHDADYGSLRWTVDTPEDLAALRAILTHFAPRRDFSWLEVLDYFQAHPELAELNAAVQHKKLYDVDERGTG
jgi:spore coat polysaccharide biosynthesis protein SpsF